MATWAGILNTSPPGDNAPPILTATAVPAVPLPGAFPLFATGLAALCLLGWLRKRKVAA